VCEALPGPVLQEFVDERACVRVHRVEEPVALPDRPADGHLAPHHIEHPLAIDSDSRVLLEDGGERSAALEPDFEAGPRVPEDAIGAAPDTHTETRADIGRTVVRPRSASTQLADAFSATLATPAPRPRRPIPPSSGMTCGMSGWQVFGAQHTEHGAGCATLSA
jgi:hypothetical protein